MSSAPLPDRAVPDLGPRTVDATDRSILERHAALVARENVIGLEAEIARLRADLEGARAKLRTARERVRARDAEIADLRASRSWRVGRAVTAPLRMFRS